MFALTLLPRDRAYADKELAVVGTVDCGRASGARCDVGTSIAVWTTDVSGYRERVVVDLSWVQRQLDAYDQDDLIYLEVRLMPDGTLQAIGVVQPDTPQTTRHRDEDDRKEAEPTLTPTPTGTVPPTSTRTPPPTTTATPSSITTPTSTVTATSTLTPTPTATATSSFTPTATATSTLTPTPVLANLALTKIDDSASRCGNDFTCWTVTVTNGGPNPATNVTVKESPSGFVFTLVTASAGTSVDGVTNVWSIGTLGVGASVTLELDAEHAGASQTNCAEVLTSDQSDPNSTPNNGNPAEDDLACSTHLNPL